MIRFLLVRFVFPLLVLFLLRALLKSVFAGFRSAPSPQTQDRKTPPSVPAGGELKKDPVCGTYVSAATSLTRTVNGSVLHFCSKECRDKYRAA
jgi:YHS domain-containing protein